MFVSIRLVWDDLSARGGGGGVKIYDNFFFILDIYPTENCLSSFIRSLNYNRCIIDIARG